MTKIVHGQPTLDGDGVKLTRIIGTHELNFFDPFLLLDEFKNDKPADYIGGFPPHPHRGFETITYMVAGNFTHEDSRGNKGHLTSGSVQWMTAGKGIIHSEMPAQVNGLVWGFQLWLNLPAKLKMTEPKYQDISAEQIPNIQKDFGSIKIISGQYENTSGPGKSFTPFTYFDVNLEASSSFTYSVPVDQNTMVYQIDGSSKFSNDGQNQTLKPYDLGLLSEGTEIKIKSTEKGSRFLFLSAQVINEPVARGGPFVMNTKTEIMQAFQDYQNGKIG